MEIKTLDHCTVTELTNAFNRAFSDYIVKFEMTEEMFKHRMKGFNLDMSISPGAFDDGKLFGFIFHGVGERNGERIVWNGGTGVAPEYRGHGVTTQLYEYILPSLKERGFENTSLEVIIGNDPAIHTYRKNGFSIQRDFDCYKGEIEPQPISEGIQLKTIESIDWIGLNFFRDWQPSYQNNDPRIKIHLESVILTGAYINDVLCGYIIFDKNPDAGDIYQFAVAKDKRRQGLGTALFYQVQAQKQVPLKLVNVDSADAASSSFLKKIGFEKTIGQHEMLKKL